MNEGEARRRREQATFELIASAHRAGEHDPLSRGRIAGCSLCDDEAQAAGGRLTRPVEADDMVALLKPRAPWDHGPIGHVKSLQTGTRFNGLKRADMSDPADTRVAWVVLDDGSGTEPFLLDELVAIDLGAWEARNAGPWRCKCSPERELRAAAVVCERCGRARPRP